MLARLQNKTVDKFFSLLTMPPQGQTQGLSYKDQDQDLRTRTTTLLLLPVTRSTNHSVTVMIHTNTTETNIILLFNADKRQW